MTQFPGDLAHYLRNRRDDTGTPERPGRQGQVIQCSGTEEANATISGFASTNVATYTAWIYPDSDTTALKGLFWSEAGGGDIAVYLQGSPGGGTGTAELRAAWSGFFSFPNVLLSINQWHHLALVFDGPEGEARAYVDGVLVDTNPQTLSSLTNPFAAQAFFTDPGNAGRNWRGQAYDLRAYNVIKTPAEIQAIRDGAIDDTGIVFHCWGNEKSGPKLYSRVNNISFDLVNTDNTFRVADPTIVNPVNTEGFNQMYDLLGDGSVQVLEAAELGQKLNITFDIKTTDSSFIFFGNDDTSGNWLLFGQDGSTSTTIAGAVITTDSITIGGTVVNRGTATRDDIHTLVATGDWVTVELLGVDASAMSNGLFLNGYNVAGQRLIGRIRNLTINNATYGPIIPAADATTDVLGEDLYYPGKAVFPERADTPCVTGNATDVAIFHDNSSLPKPDILEMIISVPLGDRGYIYSYRDDGTQLVQLYAVSDDLLRAQVRGSDNVLHQLDFDFPADEFFKVRIEYDYSASGGFDIYVNDVLAGSSSGIDLSNTIDSTQTTILARRSVLGTSANAFTGSSVASVSITGGGVKYDLIMQAGGDRIVPVYNNTSESFIESGSIRNGTPADIWANRCPGLVQDWCMLYGGGIQRNFMRDSEDITTVRWAFSNSGITRTADAIANPVDGAVTADLVQETTDSTSHRLWYYDPHGTTENIVAGETYTFSVYLRDNGSGTIRLGNDFSDTAIDLVAGTATSGQMEDVGNGWWRYSQTEVSSDAILSIIFYTSETTGAFVGDPANGFYIYGAQIEAGSVATAYQPVGSDHVTPGVFLPGLPSTGNDVLGRPKTLVANEHGNPHSRINKNPFNVAEITNISGETALAPGTDRDAIAPTNTKFSNVSPDGDNENVAYSVPLTGQDYRELREYLLADNFGPADVSGLQQLALRDGGYRPTVTDLVEYLDSEETYDDWRLPRVGQVLDLDESSSGLIYGEINEGAGVPYPFSISCKFNVDVTTTNTRSIWSVVNSSSATEYLTMFVDSGERLQIQRRKPTSIATIIATGIDIDTDYEVTIEFVSDTEFNATINGVTTNYSGLTSVAAPTNNVNLLIGALRIGSPAFYMDGQIEYLRSPEIGDYEFEEETGLIFYSKTTGNHLDTVINHTEAIRVDDPTIVNTGNSEGYGYGPLTPESSTFDSDVESYYVPSGDGATIQQVSGELEVTAGAATGSGAVKQIALIPGEEYEFSVDIRLGTSTICDCSIGEAISGASMSNSYIYAAADNTYTRTFTATSSVAYVRLSCRGVGDTAFFDNVTITRQTTNVIIPAAADGINTILGDALAFTGQCPYPMRVDTPCVDSDGALAHVVLDPPLLGLGDWSYKMWYFYTTPTPTPSRAVVWGKDSNNSRMLQIDAINTSTQEDRAATITQSGYATNQPVGISNAFTDNTWHYIEGSAISGGEISLSVTPLGGQTKTVTGGNWDEGYVAADAEDLFELPSGLLPALGRIAYMEVTNGGQTRELIFQAGSGREIPVYNHTTGEFETPMQIVDGTEDAIWAHKAPGCVKDWSQQYGGDTVRNLVEHAVDLTQWDNVDLRGGTLVDGQNVSGANLGSLDLRLRDNVPMPNGNGKTFHGFAEITVDKACEAYIMLYSVDTGFVLPNTLQAIPANVRTRIEASGTADSDFTNDLALVGVWLDNGEDDTAVTLHELQVEEGTEATSYQLTDGPRETGVFIPGLPNSNLDAEGNAKTLPPGGIGNPHSQIVTNPVGVADVQSLTFNGGDSIEANGLVNSKFYRFENSMVHEISTYSAEVAGSSDLASFEGFGYDRLYRVDFDGSTQYAEAAELDVNLFTGDSFAFEIFIEADASVGDILSVSGSGAFIRLLSANNRINFGNSGGTAQFPFEDGLWRFIHDTSLSGFARLRAFRNGVEVSQSATAGAYTNFALGSTLTRLGARTSNTEYLDGRLGAVKFFSEAVYPGEPDRALQIQLGMVSGSVWADEIRDNDFTLFNEPTVT